MGKAKAANTAKKTETPATQVKETKPSTEVKGTTPATEGNTDQSVAFKSELAAKDDRIKELESAGEAKDKRIQELEAQLSAAQTSGAPSKNASVKTKNGKYFVKHQVKIAETGKLYSKEEIAADDEIQKYLLGIKSAVLEPVK